MTTELEQTQLEIAKLQLEQERHKLAQMQKRQRVAEGLGQGAATVGGAAAKGGRRFLVWSGKLLLVWPAAYAGVVLANLDKADKSWDLGTRIGYAAGAAGSAWVWWSLLGAAIIASTRWEKKPPPR